MMASTHHYEAAAENGEAMAPRVLFITRKWGPAVGGMETYCERLTEELAKLGPIDVIALKGQSDGQPPSVLSLLLFPLTVLAALFRLKTPPAIVHLGDMAVWPLAFIALAFAPKAKVIISAHGTDVAYGARGGIKGGLYQLYMKLGAAFSKNAKVIANSRATKARLNQIGWNCDAIVPLATDLQAQPDGDFNSKQLLFAGRLVKRKGLGWFVNEVLSLLPNDLRVSVVGTKWDESEDAALEHPQVDFLGSMPQAELAQQFSKAACVIVPNIDPENGEYEGFGLVACEAASAGGLVLAGKTGGLTDAVQDGQTGFLIEAGNAQKWAAKVAQVLSQSPEERAEFLTTSHSLAQEYYSWNRVAKQTSQAYS
ncbi:MAG: glycosyltransferase family 4 protein [Erythrobacter sp.]|uniref:glycosyltransferase family 4 protein n=1 Tax=Erythrobacter sp. TaxID=1042 RepID=UPI0032986C0A